MKNEGNIMISILFVLLISFLALSLLSFSIWHTWIRGSRERKAVEADRMCGELIYYIHHFREKILAENLREYIQPEVEYFNKDHFPDTTSVNDSSLSIKNTFTHRYLPMEYYEKTRITDTIDISSVKNNYGIKCELLIDMVSGRVPVTLFPFFLDQSITVPEDVFLKEHDVIINDSRFITAAETEVEFDSTAFLLDALKIRGNTITWSAMREKFGLDISDEPIPEGIHIPIEEGTINCIFIQGHVERLVFSTQEGVQKIRVTQDGITHGYDYKPGENYFINWDNQRTEEFLFNEIIAVNGNISSLEQEGDAAFTDTAGITLYCSGNVTIRSNLESQNLALKTMKATGFTMVCSFNKLFNISGGTHDAAVEVKDETTLDASIIAGGKLTNKSKKLNLKGSVYCKDLENEGSIVINYRKSGSESVSFFRTVDYRGIASFSIDAIDEVIK